MTKIELSDIAPQTLGDEAISSISLSAVAVVSVLNDLVDTISLSSVDPSQVAFLSGASFSGDVSF